MVWTEFEFLGDFSLFLAERRIAKWPHPNTNRIKCDFRMALGEGLPFPRPDRFIGQMFDVPDTPNGRAYPVIDMNASGPFALHGTSGINEDGRTVELDIIEHPTADFPGSDHPGIEYHFVFKKTDRDDFNWTWYFESVLPVDIPRDIPMDANSSSPIGGVVEVSDDPQFLDVDWPTNFGLTDFVWFGMSICYEFPVPAPPLGMAEFNGVDAYIALDHNLTVVNQDFIISARIRLHDVTTFWPVLGVENAGGFCGMDGADLIFGNIRNTSSWTPVLDQWFTWRLEFEQETLLGYKLFIDDLEVLAITAARQQVQFNRLGVFRRTQPQVIWGNFDMQDLKYITGNAPSTNVELDMPLDTNALDLSADENHGTTFNMALPSV